MNDDPNALANRIKRTLDQRAAAHPERNAVLQHVRAATRPRRLDPVRQQLAALGLAAMVSALMLMPAPLTSAMLDYQANGLFANAPLMPPQAVEDLEMLQVLGIDQADPTETDDAPSSSR